MLDWIQRTLGSFSGRSTKKVAAVQSEGQLIAFENAFPWDIMAQILDHAIRVDHEGTKPKFVGSPYVLSQVCKDWQLYIDSKPRFWSFIIISLRRSERWRETYISGLKDSVKRAGGLPLNIYLDAECGLYDVGVRPATEGGICRFMVDSCSQWGSLDTSPVQVSFANAFYMARMTAGLPSLTYPLLRSYVVRGSRRPGDISFLSNLENIFCLRALQIAQYDEYLPFLTYNADTITNVTITTSRVFHAYEVLLSYPEAETIDIQYLSRDPPPPHLHGEKMVKSSRLRSIKITTGAVSDITFLMMRLQTPNLEDLYLHSRDVFHPGDIPSSIFHSIPATGCHLRCLSLQLVIPDEDRFILMVRTLQSLEEFYIHHLEAHEPLKTFKGLTETFFNKLHPESGFAWLPKLKTLTYEGALAIDSLEPLDGLVSRMYPRQTLIPHSDSDTPNSESGELPQPEVRLRFVKIVTDQKWPLFGPIQIRDPGGLSKLMKSRSFAKTQNIPVSAELLERTRCLIDRNALWLLNADGSKWR